MPDTPEAAWRRAAERCADGREVESVRLWKDAKRKRQASLAVGWNVLSAAAMLLEERSSECARSADSCRDIATSYEPPEEEAGGERPPEPDDDKCECGASLVAEWFCPRCREWVRVQERLPDLREVVLIVDVADGVSSALRAKVSDNELGWAWWTHGGTYIHPEHGGIVAWLPINALPALPAPPQGGE